LRLNDTRFDSGLRRTWVGKFLLGPAALKRRVRLLCLLLLASCWSLPSGAEELFKLRTIPSAGRVVAARIADVNGDSRADVFVVAIEGMPPTEQRVVRVFLQGPDGSLPTQPNHFVALPQWSGVYDLADVLPRPGVEMVLLAPHGVSILSLATADSTPVLYPVEGGSVAIAEDERGFEPVKIVFDDFGPTPRLLVPQFGGLVVMETDGRIAARLTVPRRANFYVIPSNGFVSSESDVQLFVDVPKIAVGDVDGDGRTDIVASTRHEIGVFMSREDGTFDAAPSRTVALGMVTRRDHIRGTGGVSCEFRDVNLDGRLDLLVTHVEGSIADAVTTTRVFTNRDGNWLLDNPDGQYQSTDALASNKLVDLDRDGLPELLRIQIKFTLLEFIELLLTREVDALISIHGQAKAPGVGFTEEPSLTRSVSIPFRFDTFRAKGFVPTVSADLNGDGHADLLASGAGDAVEVFIGGGTRVFARRSVRQKMPTAGVISFADMNADGLTDFVIFDPHNFDMPVQVAINLGALPGTPEAKRLGAQWTASEVPSDSR
jgi:hypothetical protein